MAPYDPVVLRECVSRRHNGLGFTRKSTKSTSGNTMRIVELGTIRLSSKSDGSVLGGLQKTLYAQKEELNFKRYYFRCNFFLISLHIRDTVNVERVRFAYGARIRDVRGECVFPRMHAAFFHYSIDPTTIFLLTRMVCNCYSQVRRR